MIQLVQPQSAEDWRQARLLVEEYAASLNVDLSFQNFAHEVEHLASEYALPTGGLLLAEENGAYLGCVGLRKFDAGIAEIKRLYIVPAARGRRLGYQLVEGVIALARQLGYTRLLLDTLPSMTEARSLYQSLGFKPTTEYRYNPVPGATFLTLELR